MRLPLAKNKLLHAKSVFSAALLILIPLVIMESLLAFSTGNIFSTARWAMDYPNEFFLSYIIMFAVTNIFYILPQRLYFAISTIMYIRIWALISL